MVLPQAFLDNIRQADDVYKVIVVCYDMLLEYKDDTDMVFVSQVGHLSQDAEYGEASEVFEDLRQRLIAYTEKIDMDFENDGTGFEYFQSILLEELTQFVCPASMDTETCLSFCMFYTLEALDSYVNKNIDSVYINYENFGPLNGNTGMERSVVYLQERSSFLGGAYEGGRSGFRKPLRCTRIGSVFHAILLMRCQEFRAAVPQIIPIALSDGCRDTLLDTKTIRIASIPYIGFETFKFHETNSVNPCNSSQVPNGPFYIEYADNDENDSRRVVALLDLAIQQNANIIIFPEFIMSGKMLNNIKEYLRQLEYGKKRHLLLVLAGTNYQRNNKNDGNNILHILNANGCEVGRYYKYSPFLQQSEENFHGISISTKKDQDQVPLKREYLTNCEILSNPGKECTFVDIELLGRIQPAICRDVIDGVYTDSLSALFAPSFLMVPAWSPSVASFGSRFAILADTIHTASLLCNSCNAVEGDEEKVIGTFMYPSKQGSHMEAFKLDIKRRSLCLKNCVDSGGCIAQIDIDFSEGKPTATYQMLFPCCTA